MPAKGKEQAPGRRKVNVATVKTNLEVKGGPACREGRSPSPANLKLSRPTGVGLGETFVVKDEPKNVNETKAKVGSAVNPSKSRGKWNTKPVSEPVITVTDARQVPSTARARHRALSQLKADHDRTESDLQSRCLRLKVALTHWNNHGCSALVSFLIKTNDYLLLNDLLPVITCSLFQDKTRLEMAACVELFPLLKSLIASKHDTHVRRALDFLKEVIKGRKEELHALKSSQQPDLIVSRSIPEIYVFIQSMRDTLHRLSSQRGQLGEAAKAVGDCIRQI